MCVTVKEVTTRKQFADFVDLPYRLYKGHPCFAPPLRFDEVATLRKDKNPAFDYCEAKYWLAYKDGRVAGRIAGIINYAYLKKWKNPYLRFGWVDFENDEEIVKSLMEKVEAWAREKDLKAVHGPLGFTDLDHEGMLVAGYDQLGTLATIYNFPYYPQLLEKLGYKKDIDWVEYKIKIPNSMPEKLSKGSSTIQRRLVLQLLHLRSSKEIIPYTKEIFELINSTSSDLYGVVPLARRQVDYYTKLYFPSFNPILFFWCRIGMENLLPSASPCLRCLWHCKKQPAIISVWVHSYPESTEKNRLVDLYLVAVRKDLQGKGANAHQFSCSPWPRKWKNF